MMEHDLLTPGKAVLVWLYLRIELQNAHARPLRLQEIEGSFKVYEGV